MDQCQTTSLAEAAYIICQGFEPVAVLSKPYTTIKTFVFDKNCGEIGQEYYSDALVPARAYQAAFQEVRRLIRS